MRPRLRKTRAFSGRRLGLATAAVVALAGFAPTTAFAALDDFTTSLTEADATVADVTSTVTELTAPVSQATQTTQTSNPTPVAEPVQQVTTASPPPVVAETVAPLTKPLEPATAPLANTTNEVAKATTPVTSVVQSATAPVTTPVERAAAPVLQAVQQTAQPVVATVQRATAPVVATVAQAAAPVLATVDQVAAPTVAAVSPLLQQTAAQVIAPIVDTTGQILEPVAKATVQAMAPLDSRAARNDAPPLGPVQATTTPSSHTGSVGGPTHQPGVVGPARVAPAPAETASSPSPVRRHGAGAAQRLTPPTQRPRVVPVLMPEDAAAVNGSPSSSHATVSQTRAPDHPFAPDRPFGFSATAATGGASFFVPLFAVIAAIFLLAALGVGRRLRPALAPPRLPILALSLERPG